MVDCYVDADFVDLWVHENPQDPICASIRAELVVTFSNFLLLWVSKLQTDSDLSTTNYEYVTLSHSFRDLLPLKSLTKEVIDNLVFDSEKLKFVSSSTVYKENNGAIVVSTSQNMALT